MDYITVDQLKARHNTGLPETALADIIAEESAAITCFIGKEPGSPMVDIFMEPGVVLALTFKADPGQGIEVYDLAGSTVVDSETYFVDGRLIYRRKSSGSWYNDMDIVGARPGWPKKVRVTYAIQDSPGILAVLRGVCLDLCRLAMADTGYLTQSIGKYSYSSKEIAAERKKIMGRLVAVTGLRPVMGR